MPVIIHQNQKKTAPRKELARLIETGDWIALPDFDVQFLKKDDKYHAYDMEETEEPIDTFDTFDELWEMTID
jgi:hypothetical protein